VQRKEERSARPVEGAELVSEASRGSRVRWVRMESREGVFGFRRGYLCCFWVLARQGKKEKRSTRVVKSMEGGG